jgi:hypothetical protein
LKGLYIGLNPYSSARKRKERTVTKSNVKCVNVHYRAAYVHTLVIYALGILWNK